MTNSEQKIVELAVETMKIITKLGRKPIITRRGHVLIAEFREKAGKLGAKKKKAEDTE